MCSSATSDEGSQGRGHSVDAPGTSRPAVLYQARALGKTYGSGEAAVTALAHVNFTFELGRFIAITGQSGSGKTTLLSLLGLMAQPTSGELIFRGERVSGFDVVERAALRNREIGFVFQAFQLLEHASALENAALPLLYSGIRGAQRTRRAREALERVGLGHRLHHRPGELSGGEQQRAGIARAIVNEPSVLLADEPTGALDSNTGAEILGLLRMLNRQGMSVIVITHNEEIARQADHNLVLADGRVEAFTNPSERPGGTS